ncbi:MAG: nuclear transport factor 2 family protein [Eudoraea sp.]|nr:nuclear transport factor 2 family protein [Eudoraea sp.]
MQFAFCSDQITGNKCITNISIAAVFLGLFFISCSSKNEPDIPSIAKEFYKTYQERADFEGFLNFYDNNMVLEDVIFGERKVGKEAFAEFFDWDNELFTKKDSLALIIEKQVIEGNEVVTQGYFTPFSWGDTEVGNMHFTTILTFNEEGKIIRHVDWINYPNTLINYEKRKDSNSWIED